MKKVNQKEFFYEGGGRNKARSQIMHCARFSPGLTLLTGDQGAGCSFLLKQIKQSFHSEEGDFCLIPDDIPILETEEDLYQAMAKGFGIDDIDVNDIELLVEHVQRFINVGLVEKRIIIVAVDEIQHHSMEVIDALIQFAGGNKGLNLILSGDGRLFDTLKQFHIQNLIVHQITLRPLLVEEISEFLTKAMVDSGEYMDFTPSMKMVNELMARTGGNLGLLAQEVQLLKLDEIAGGKKVPTGLPVGHLAAMVAVLTVLLLVFIYYPEKNGSGKVTPEQQLAFDNGKVFDEESAVNKGVDKRDIQPLHETANESVDRDNQQESEQVAISVADLEPEVPDPLHHSAAQKSIETVEKSLAISEQVQQETNLVEASQLSPDVEVSEADKETAIVNTAEINEAVEVDTVTEERRKGVQSDSPQRTDSRRATHRRGATPDDKQQAPVVAQTEPVSAEISFVERLRSMPGNYYTLQLVGVSTEQAAIQFLQNYPQQNNFYGYYHKSLKGKPWYIVLFGSFPDKQSALNARKDLPAAVQKSKPWLRRFSAVQGELTP